MIKKKSKVKIGLVILCSLVISIIYVNSMKLNEDSIYEIYMGERVIGYMGEKYDAKIACSDAVDGINSRISESNITTNQITYKKVKNEVAVSDKDELQNKILSCLSTETALTSLVINGENYGFIANEKEGKEVLKKVGDIYIDSIDINKEDIISIDIKSNIQYENVKTEISNISSTDDIAMEIFNDNNKDIVDVAIKYRETKTVDIAPAIKTISLDDMYIGERKEEEGTPGSKEITEDITYKNGTKIEETVIDEKVLVEAKETVVYIGNKNPIDSEVAFLGHPTRGGYVTSNFGSRWGRNHNGIDISHNTGDPVYATFDGTVKEASYKNSYGNKILLEHEGKLETIYAHLNSFNVKVGDKVKKGDLIGRVGNTGNSTGSHLHFELRVEGKPVDPRKYIEEELT